MGNGAAGCGESNLIFGRKDAMPIKFQFGKIGSFDIITIGFVDDNSIRHFHDSAFDTRIVARTRNF
jgi:hypothetical protein